MKTKSWTAKTGPNCVSRAGKLEQRGIVHPAVKQQVLLDIEEKEKRRQSCTYWRLLFFWSRICQNLRRNMVYLYRGIGKKRAAETSRDIVMKELQIWSAVRVRKRIFGKTVPGWSTIAERSKNRRQIGERYYEIMQHCQWQQWKLHLCRQWQYIYWSIPESVKRIDAGLKELEIKGGVRRDSDHSWALRSHSGTWVFSRKYEIPIYATRGTIAGIQAYSRPEPCRKIMSCDTQWWILYAGISG